MYICLILVYTPFSYGRGLIVCSSLQKFSKTKGSAMYVIWNVDTAFLLCGAEIYQFKVTWLLSTVTFKMNTKPTSHYKGGIQAYVAWKKTSLLNMSSDVSWSSVWSCRVTFNWHILSTSLMLFAMGWSQMRKTHKSLIMWCDLGKSVWNRTCNIFSFLLDWSAH